MAIVFVICSREYQTFPLQMAVSNQETSSSWIGLRRGFTTRKLGLWGYWLASLKSPCWVGIYYSHYSNRPTQRTVFDFHTTCSNINSKRLFWREKKTWFHHLPAETTSLLAALWALGSVMWFHSPDMWNQLLLRSY
jgi:hypothetical protein